jgi:deoxyadenosine/deoxycytidine kinase
VDEPPVQVAVSGLIGAGKSTLVAGLAPLLGFEALPEAPLENPYLARFYEDPQRWAFHSLTFFVEHTLSGAVAARARGASTLQERVVAEHMQIFAETFLARGYIERADIDLLTRLLDTASPLLAPERLLVHVDIEPELALRRIHGRGFAPERAVDLAYLEELAGRYERFVADWSASPVLRVSAEELDFREAPDLRALAAMVCEALDLKRAVR